MNAINAYLRAVLASTLLVAAPTAIIAQQTDQARLGECRSEG